MLELPHNATQSFLQIDDGHLYFTAKAEPSEEKGVYGTIPVYNHYLYRLLLPEEN